jgi:CheY-like chemotaxis protein
LIILLVEDNPDHTELVRRALQEHRVLNTIQSVPDGEAALDYLFRRNAYADPEHSPRPHVILLDLRLPRIDGLEVLRQIKADEALRAIPVVILTTSEAEKDMTRAYANHVNSYLIKPMDFNRFSQMMRDLGFYWLAWNRVPWS